MLMALRLRASRVAEWARPGRQDTGLRLTLVKVVGVLPSQPGDLAEDAAKVYPKRRFGLIGVSLGQGGQDFVVLKEHLWQVVGRIETQATDAVEIHRNATPMDASPADTTALFPRRTATLQPRIDAAPTVRATGSRRRPVLKGL